MPAAESESLAQALREARRDSGIGFDRFARLAGYSEGHLRSVENGRRAITEDVAAAYDRVLGTGGIFSVHFGVIANPEGAEWGRAGTETVLATLTHETDNVNRRSVLALSGAAITAMAVRWADAFDARQLPTGTGHQRVHASLVEHIGQRLDHMRHLDDQIGSGEIARLAANELALIARLIRTGTYDELTGRHLYALAAEASRQAAWGHFDQDHHGLAHRYFDLSLRASADAGDPLTGAYAMSFLAVQCYSTGQAQEAVAILEAAQAATARVGTARMRAMLAARTARALSKTGDTKNCARMLGIARAALDQGASEDDPPVLYWVSETEIEMIAGSCALDLGDSRQAIRSFDAAVAAGGATGDFARSQAIYFARAAEAHVQIGDLDGAVARAEDARRCLTGVDSARSTATLARLRAELRAHETYAPIRDFLQSTA